ncbi:alpha/beta hydrolase [Flavivirga jejuensis]|uniref:Alpha/beta hydrolase n=1 Tax=Flavivirga jejuensis TaxID=870487 RepID=A0ABT8WKL5_9FLAO|nr:alpha/beta hydrolase [Flavivirga jejuensis]MDO5973693.1 alpha/beta hydrolase [Flavivirga jejuensis]
MVKYLITTLVVLLTTGHVNSQNKDSKETDPLKEVVYKEVDGNKLKLSFYYPNKFNKRKQYPTMIFFFGGGWTGGSTAQFKDQAIYFASRGMITVLADYRVKSRHQTTPFESVKDAKSAIRYLRNHAKEFGIHPNKIIASGGSAGGHIAAASSLVSGLNETGEDVSVSTKANALVLFNPVVDMSPDGFANDKVGDRYLEISPMQNITKGAPPTIIFLGTKDKIIPVSIVEKFKSKMEAVGSRCDLRLYEGQPHGFFNKGRQEADKCYIATVFEADLFLQSLGYIKGEETITKSKK